MFDVDVLEDMSVMHMSPSLMHMSPSFVHMSPSFVLHKTCHVKRHATSKDMRPLTNMTTLV